MSHRVVVMQTGVGFDVNVDESVLEAALRQNVQLAHECKSGGCGTCRIKLVKGQVRYEDFPIALTPEEDQLGFALACQARPLSDLTISIEAYLAPLCEPVLRVAVVRDVQAFSSEVTHLSLELADFDGFDYRPGQYMNVQLDDGTHRSFSMASLPNAGRLDFHVRRIPGGLFTTHRLAQLRVGERLRVELPLGEFQLDKAAYRPLVMVATGTGIAPIKSLLESLLDDADCPPVWLYWGMRTEEDLYLRDEILSWSHRLYEFQFVPVLSRASLGWSGRRGHVQHAVIEDLPELSEHAIYLCGSPTMISEAKTIFLAHGAPIEHIHADGFSFQHAHNRLPTLPSTPALEPAIHLT